MRTYPLQLSLLGTVDLDPTVRDSASTTFTDNMRLPVHRWFRYSAGFSAEWVESVIKDRCKFGKQVVLDPFAGSGTTLIAAQQSGAASVGLEAHPFVTRVARAKLQYRESPDLLRSHARSVIQLARITEADVKHYPSLIQRCYSPESLNSLDQLRRAWEALDDGSPASCLSWLALVSILRSTSAAGTAPWQYALPNKSKKSWLSPMDAYSRMIAMMLQDMVAIGMRSPAEAALFQDDARMMAAVKSDSVNLVITSPPYPNNYDYADATRLEMSFFGEVSGWGDLQLAVRQFLVRSCSQHMQERTDAVEQYLDDAAVDPIRDELATVCAKLERERNLHGGRKNYHLMVAAYFVDMAKIWNALRRVCSSPAEIIFVIGDSAPYGVYVPVMDWNATLAKSAGFVNPAFEKTRDRNVKWKNRKHRVPLAEGRLRALG